MNHIYRQVWSATQRAWVVTGELSRARKKTLLCVAISLGCTSAMAATTPTDIAPDTPFNASTTTGSNGTTGENGDIAYLFSTPTGADPSQYQVTIAQDVTITGGTGGNSGTSTTSGATGTNGGTAISGGNFSIINKGSITGGKGGTGGTGGAIVDIIDYKGGAGGIGSVAIEGDNLSIINSGAITGGAGGTGGTGGSGGYGGPGGAGGAGGTAIRGDNLSINNSGTISGGAGGAGGVWGTSTIDSPFFKSTTNGGGGTAISGSHLSITNSGTISGGKTIYDGDAGDSAGGTAINGDNLSITNSGTITAGEGGTGQDSNAITLTGGSNTLILDKGSLISGGISLASASTGENSLSVISNIPATLSGNLNIGNKANLSLSGKALTVTGDLRFNGNNTLTLNADDTVLEAGNVSFNNTAINVVVKQWGQSAYTLISTTGGISGTYANISSIADYATLYTSDDRKNLMYGLRWNAQGDSAGTFDITAGDSLSLSAILADNTTASTTGWNGKNLTKSGDGILILNAANTYTGETLVSAGELTTGISDAFASTSGVIVAPGATLNLGGNSQHLATGATLNNSGTLLINDAGASVLSNIVALYGDVINSGTVIINNGRQNAGQTLQVNGNWTGSGGTVSLGTVLGGDDSLTDKLAITGSATGTTFVAINNEGGTGALTVNGIEVITTGSSTANAFVQSGRIAAGAYDYTLVRGIGSNDNNWYLSSAPPASSDTSTAHTTDSLLRPEGGAYAANQAAANNLFVTTLQDRSGETPYTDTLTGEKKVTSMWIHNVGGHNSSRDSSGQLRTQSNRYVLQLGGDLAQWSMNGDDGYHLGIMGGYANSKSSVVSRYSGYRARGSVEGYSTGLYGTWYANDADKTGLYVDSFAQYSWFNNTVSGQDLSAEKYHSRGLTASVESGYAFRLGQNATGTESYFLQPKAQVTWMGVKADRHTESNGTVVTGEGDGNIQTRLGVKSYLNGHSKIDEGKNRTFQPFAEVDWVHNTNAFGSRMDGVLVKRDGAANIAEIKVGVEGQLNKRLSLWGNVAQQVGAQGYSDTAAIVGGKYSF